MFLEKAKQLVYELLAIAINPQFGIPLTVIFPITWALTWRVRMKERREQEGKNISRECKILLEKKNHTMLKLLPCGWKA